MTSEVYNQNDMEVREGTVYVCFNLRFFFNYVEITTGLFLYIGDPSEISVHITSQIRSMNSLSPVVYSDV